MITHPLFVGPFLFFVVLSLKILSEKKRSKMFFQFLPLPFWCYFIPTLLSSFGILPNDLPLYSMFGRIILPCCLFLLLIGTDIKSIFHLKGQSLLAMTIGSVGIFIGGLITYGIAINILPSLWKEELWKGWGALSATWSGGSANMLAIKEITHIPAPLFSNLIVTDTFIAYFWMAFLVFLSKYQTSIDKKLNALPLNFTESNLSNSNFSSSKIPLFKRYLKGFFLLVISILSAFLFMTLSHDYAWTILFATFVPLALSQTSLKSLEEDGASSLGQFLLMLMLASIGVRANLSHLGSAPLFILLGFIWVIIHGIVLLILGKICRIPFSLLATASQANVGGTVSAPLVASIYSKNLTPIGVVLATLGNIYGTYFGLFFSHVCRNILNVIK